MNNFWIKIISLAAIVAGLIIFVKFGMKKLDDEINKPPQTTISDQFRKDNEKFRPSEDELAAQAAANEQRVSVPKKKIEVKADDAKEVAIEPAAPKVYRKLDEIEDIQAQRLLEQAIFHRKQSRLGGMGVKKAVEICREIIEKYPQTIYEEKAKVILGSLPDRFKDRYKVTNDEMIITD